MKVVDSYLDDSVLDTSTRASALRYQYMSYDIDHAVVSAVKNQLLEGTVVFMFSGSWRLDFDATYLELRMFKNCGLPFHASTLFVEPNELKLFNLTLSKLAPTNLIILHSDYWCRHSSIEDLLDRLDQLLPYVQSGGQVICTVPIRHIHFNRLTMSVDDLLEYTNGVEIGDRDNSIIIVRK
jgi:hypothetical protein